MDINDNSSLKLGEPNYIIVFGVENTHYQFLWFDSNILYYCRIFWTSREPGLVGV